VPPPKKPTGRPRATVDLALVEKLAGIACTLEEIADVTGVSKSTLLRLGKQTDFSKAIQRGRSKGKVSLRRLQWQSAEGIFETIEDPAGKKKPRRRMIVPPNVTAQIWLGKQMLGQRTEPETARETADKVKYEWVSPKSQGGSRTILSPVNADSTMPAADSKDSVGR
jgi:hypothetical protein